MKYPTINFSDAARYVLGQRNPDEKVSLPEPRLRGEGRNISHELHEAITNAFKGWPSRAEKISNQQQKDALEGEYAIKLFTALSFLLDSPEVLTDRDFWRFIAINHLYEFCEWRETRTSTPCSPAAWGADSRSIDRDCVPYRMFNRALVARSIGALAGDENLDYSKIASGDLWKSHVLRADISYSASMSKTLLDNFDRGNLNTTSVRGPIKNIGRLHANIYYEVFAEDDSQEIWNSELHSK